MTKDDNAVLEEAANTTTMQLADGWLTWANTQQPATTSQAPKNTEMKLCDVASCAPKQWQLSVQTKEIEASDLRIDEDQPPKTQVVTPPQLPAPTCTAIDPDLVKFAFSFRQYLNRLPGVKAYASVACKVVYQQLPDAQEILNVVES